jgi:hypothetical protein
MTTATLYRFLSTIETMNGNLEIAHDPSMSQENAELIARFVLSTEETFTYLVGSAQVHDGEGLSVYLHGTGGFINILGVNAWGGECTIRRDFDEDTGVESMHITRND